MKSRVSPGPGRSVAVSGSKALSRVRTTVVPTATMGRPAGRAAGGALELEAGAGGELAAQEARPGAGGVLGVDEEDLDPAAAWLARVQPRREDPGVVDDEERVAQEQRREIGEDVVDEGSVG